MLERFVEQVAPDWPDPAAQFVKLLAVSLKDKRWVDSVRAMVASFNALCTAPDTKGDKAHLATVFTDGVGKEHLVKAAERSTFDSASLLADDLFEEGAGIYIDMQDIDSLTAGGSGVPAVTST